MLLCPSNSGAAVVDFSTTAPQHGDTAEQMLGKMLAAAAGRGHNSTDNSLIVGGDPAVSVAFPRPGRSSVTLSSLDTNTDNVFLYLTTSSGDVPPTGFGHPLVPGGSVTFSRAIHGNLDEMVIKASANAGSQNIIVTDW